MNTASFSDAAVPENKNTLDALRAQIDAIDEALQELFERRMALVDEIAAEKRSRGLPIFAPIREEEKLAAIKARAGAGLEPYDEAFFRRVMELSRRRQEEPSDEPKE